MTEWIRWPSQRGSWHIVRTWTRMPGRAIALCGRTVDGESATAPGDRTCERCFQIRERA